MGISKLKLQWSIIFPRALLNTVSCKKTETVIFILHVYLLMHCWSNRGNCYQCLLKCDIVKVILPLITALLHWGNGEVRHSWCYRGDEMLCWCFLLRGGQNKTPRTQTFCLPSRGWRLGRQERKLCECPSRLLKQVPDKVKRTVRMIGLFLCLCGGFMCCSSVHCEPWIMIRLGSDSIGGVHLYLTLVVSRSCH